MENPDIMRNIATYVGDKDYIGVATLSLLWKEVWGERPKKSRAIGHGMTPKRLLLAFDTSLKKTSELTLKAVKIGRLDILKMCMNNGCPWNVLAFSAAAKRGNMEIVKFLKENGCPWNEWACSQAARWGNIEILKYLIDNGCPWDEWTLSDAARGGHLEILKYMKTKGAEYDEHTMAGAARGGQHGIIIFLMRDGCQCDDQMMVDSAARGGYIEILKKFIRMDCDYHTVDIAAKKGHVDILKFLKTLGAVWHIETLMGAIEGGHLETVKFLVEDGCPREEDGYDGAHCDAWNADQTQIIEWLEENVEEYRGISASYKEEDEEFEYGLL